MFAAGKNGITNVLKAVDTGELTVDPARLRSTWLVSQLNRRVPLPVLLRAAHLETTQTISDLLPYLDDYNPDQSIEWLTGTGTG